MNTRSISHKLVTGILTLGALSIGLVVLSQWLVWDQTSVLVIHSLILIVLVLLLAVVIGLVVLNRRAMDSKEEELEESALALTKARESNRDLALARDRAHAASEAKSQFLADMSHEIRTPMNGVVGIASVLSRTELTTNQREYVETLHKSGMSLLKILNRVLDFSKIEAGKVTLDVQNFSVQTIVDDTLHLFSAEAARHDLVLESTIEPDVPKILRGDFVRLGQIFSNLVSNAIKFSKDGKITVTGRLSDDQAADNNRIQLLFEVNDPGIGIPEESLSCIFQHFEQANGPSTPSKGTGLGLSICRELVLLMGGQIGVRSKLGEGSTFWFTARFEAGIAESDTRQLKQQRQQHQETEQAFAHSARGSVAAGRWAHINGKVLVVDDNQINRLVAHRMLEELGFDVDLATNGRDAVDAANECEYAIILMDCQMPGMDGNEATRLIRRIEGDQKRAPIIALTAHATVSERVGGFSAGVDEYLSKPITLDDLEVVLSSWLSSDLDTPIKCPMTHKRRSSLRAARKVDANQPPEPISRESFLDMSIVEELRGIATSDGCDLFSDLAGQILGQMPEWLEEVGIAASQNDIGTVRRLAHKLLGTFRQLGAEQLAPACADLASIDRNCRDSNLIRKIEILHEEFDALSRVLRDQIDMPGPAQTSAS